MSLYELYDWKKYGRSLHRFNANNTELKELTIEALDILIGALHDALCDECEHTVDPETGEHECNKCQITRC